MSADLKYPEMKDFPWVKELERIHKKGLSKAVKGAGGLLSEQPKIPVNLLLAVMRNASERPEVMAAYASAPVDGQIPPREAHLIMWFNEYVLHKYGNNPDIGGETITPLRKLANGMYFDLDDPKLRHDLLDSPFISNDDGINYE